MKELSLDRLLRVDKDITLLDIVPVLEDAYPTCSTLPRLKISQARRSIEIDQDVVDAIRKRFGVMPLGRAIRIMLGLEPKIAQNAWQEEEDELIRKYYPQYGSKPLIEALGRGTNSIRERAMVIGVKRVWLYKRDRRGQKR